MEEELKIIPTTYKAKLPRALSYSCGAKTLSVAWQGVPQFDSFDLQFRCDVPLELRGFSGHRDILSVYLSKWHFTQSSRFWEEREDGKLMWNINVRACRCEDAHEVRQWLRDKGLGMARSWLEHDAHLKRQSSWLATFDEDSREFAVRHG